MTEPKGSLLSQAEAVLKARHGESRVPSTARAPRDAPRIDQLVLPDSERGRMPFTKDKYIVAENPELVQWEREVRKFLRNLSPRHEHRVAGVMIYEWATGIKLSELVASVGNATSDLRKIN